MRILVDINHPSQVHLFKNAISHWQDRGDEILITARDKDVSFELLDSLSLKYVKIKANKSSWLAYPFAVLNSDWNVYREGRKFDPDFMIGTSFAVAHVSRLLRGRSVVFGEDDLASTRLFWAITSPFADYVITPDTILDTLGKRHIKYAGAQELAYLHPKYFRASKEILDKVGIGREEAFSIIRFVSLKATHDKGQSGISPNNALEIIKKLSVFGRVIINSEKKLSPELETFRLNSDVDDIHHLLAHAQILVSDSQSMTIEAGLLGTPSVRINSFAGRIPVIEEMELKYGLTYAFFPEKLEKALEKINSILENSDNGKKWAKRKQKYVADKIDLTAWIIDFIDKIHKGF